MKEATNGEYYKFTRRKLLKDLPGCPAGRYFTETISGDWFHSMTDKEHIEGKFQDYHLKKQTVLDNPSWFGKPFIKKITPGKKAIR